MPVCWRWRTDLYLEYFGLTEAPFSITPDPAFVFLSQRHRDALAHLLYGVGQGGAGGFVQLTGEVGTGKTTLCRCLLEQVPEQTQIALILNPLMTPRELLAAICEELGVEIQGLEDSNKALVDRLNLFLLQAHENGERVVVVIDEAQNLSPESLEQVRLLTNLETSKQKLLQIVLLGQPELRELLQRTSLRQLAQRITARYHLTPLGVEDTASYVRHRMQIAGAVRNPFRKSALRALFQRSHGVPRLINIIADRALVGAYAGENQDINAGLIHAAADEVQLGEPGARRGNWRWLLAATAGIAMAILVWSYLKPDASIETTALATANEVASETQTTEIVSPSVEQPAVPANVAVQNGRVSTPVDEDWLVIQNQAAWQGLAALWNEPDAASVIETACNSETRSRWACLRSDGSLARIRLLGLPVILQLSGNRAGHLLLQGIDGEQLLVGAPGTTRTIDRKNIEDRWFGAYFVAWPQSSSWPREVARGDTGPAVEMVVDLASLADSPYAGSNEFGPDFEDWLIAFQQRNGLDADGIVGPTTLLYLIRPSIPEPVLKNEWEQEN
jgi:general secretion pathway protein A